MQKINTMFACNKPIKHFLPLKNKLPIIAVVLLLGLTACDKPKDKAAADSSSDTTGSPQTSAPVQAQDTSDAQTQTPDSTASKQADNIEFIEINEKINSDASPLGYWEKNLRYPKVKLSNTQMAQKINHAIEQLVNQFRCESGGGDQGFESQVTYNNANILSFTYNAMWMCDTMPHPDSNPGAAIFDLDTGDKINIDEQLTDKAASDKLATMALDKLTAALKQKQESAGLQCPPPTPSKIYYLDQNAKLVYRASYAEQVDSGCELDIALPLSEVKALFKPGSSLSNL